MNKQEHLNDLVERMKEVQWLIQDIKSDLKYELVGETGMKAEILIRLLQFIDFTDTQRIRDGEIPGEGCMSSDTYKLLIELMDLVNSFIRHFTPNYTYEICRDKLKETKGTAHQFVNALKKELENDAN